MAPAVSVYVVMYFVIAYSDLGLINLTWIRSNLIIRSKTIIPPESTVNKKLKNLKNLLTIFQIPTVLNH